MCFCFADNTIKHLWTWFHCIRGYAHHMLTTLAEAPAILSLLGEYNLVFNDSQVHKCRLLPNQLYKPQVLMRSLQDLATSLLEI